MHGGTEGQIQLRRPAAIHEVPDAIPGIELDMWQTGPERQRWSVAQALLSETILLSGQMAAPYAAHITAQAACIFILRGGGPWLINGCPVNEGAISFLAPGAEVNVAAAGPCAWYGVQMSLEQWQRYAVAFDPDLLHLQHGVSSLGTLGAPQLHALQGTVSAVLSHTGRALEAPGARPPLDSLQREVVRLITRAAQGDGAPLRSGHERIARQAMAYLREHDARIVYAADLCLAIGISDRWLREAFWRVYGTTLTRLLRLRRLNQARRQLLSGSSSVTEVASAHGFFDLGRFAGAYRELFGETPSTTARRQRRRDMDVALSGNS